jgi:glutamate-1-semialdehyde 2,1-aminomutase/spore coat polysaccharide biosynthesis protein SpsF
MSNSSPRVAAVIQARMSSSRFPGKMLADLGGKTLLARVVERVRACPGLDAVVLATSDRPDDAELARAAEALDVVVHRGEYEDVLARFIGAVRKVRADWVVRVTGDCPLVDPDLMAEMISRAQREKLDYLSNVDPPSYPDGLDLEVIRAAALEAASSETRDAHDREHVTPFLRERPGRFKQANQSCPEGDFSDLHWSIDTPEDLNVVAEVLSHASKTPGWRELVTIARDHAELARRSKAHRPNEGGIASLKAGLDSRKPRPSIVQSEHWWTRALDIVPAGTQTLSKGPTQFIRGFAPKYLQRGKGARVWDVDGNEYIDYPMGLGPVTLGHAHPEVTAAVHRQLEQGNCFTLMHPLEVELSERVRSIVPCAEMVRFGKNGSDATSACIRAARAKTGRTQIARHGYHGWQDWSIESSYGIRSKGVPVEVLAMTTAFPYNDLAALERVLAAKPCAAVIMEPVNLTAPAPGYLEGVRELATRFGAVLVFDEVITGFRYARGGAQEYFGVTPDLCAMGKGVANGHPLSIVCGSREFMQPFEDIFFSFTFGGEVSALAAAMATLDVMERENYWAHVWRQGAKLQTAFNCLAEEHGLHKLTVCQGLPPWTVVTFSDHDRWSALQLKTLFQQEMIRHGVLFSGSQFLSLQHGDAEIGQTIDAYRQSMQLLRMAINLKAVEDVTCGRVNEVIFRRG